MGKRTLIPVFAKINKESGEIHYHRDSWEGPLVTPRRFYPSNLIELVNNTGDSFKEEDIPSPSELFMNLPKDEKINAYVLGDKSYFNLTKSVSIIGVTPGPEYKNGSVSCSESFLGASGYVSVNYCSLSKKDLEKGLYENK